MTDAHTTHADSTGAPGGPAAPVSEGRQTGPARMKAIGGSRADAFNTLIGNQTTAALWSKHESESGRSTQALAALAALTAIAPRSELEGMLAAQLVACHNAAMECFRRAMLPEQPPEIRNANLAHAGRLTRAYAALVEALDRGRGEGLRKTVTVEHHVHRVEPAVGLRTAPPSHASHKGNGYANGHAPHGIKAPGGAALP